MKDEKNSTLDPKIQRHKKMMTRGHGMAVKISGKQENQITNGSIRVISWNRRERIVRALKYGASCWGLALLSIAIPLLHFVLVPLFFLSGPLVALFILGQHTVILGGEGTCPDCHKFMTIVRSRYQFPFSDTCESCFASLKVQML